MDKNNIDKNQLNGLLNAVSKKIGVPPEQLRKELEAGKFDSALSGMSKGDAEKFRMAVNNPKIIEKMMSTPQAKALYEKLSGRK
ncbi:MAG: transporter substrate-binding domain-containing protein [Ruminococcus flavefaciens]|nr:transporter substrate-binding domain-containing protein [Ruminococcus flavefaciens]MCM1230336.1 transporter substrate-binding domain-containing protein [Ruminococcus flavefaciens]